MAFKKRHLTAGHTFWLRVAVLLLLGFIHPISSAELYRYRDENGRVVVDYRIPASYVKRGYEVLNVKGRVIKTVPAELTKEQRHALGSQEKQAVESAAEQRRLRKWDESLLLRYSTVADIEAARERALQSLQIRLNILRSSRRLLKQQVESYQTQAADIERSGQSVDHAHLTTIESLQRQIEFSSRAIADRNLEMAELSARYQRDIMRFSMLLETVELRRLLELEEQQKQREQDI